MRELGVTVIHVTHDPDEAFSVGDRVAVIRRGATKFRWTRHPRFDVLPAIAYVTELIHHQTGGLSLLTERKCDATEWTLTLNARRALADVRENRSISCGNRCAPVENFHPGMEKSI